MTGSDRLTTKHVLTLIGDEIVCLLEKRNVVENDLESCLSELRKLQGGLQVNVSFSGAATAFELTTGFRLFQLLGIQVLFSNKKKRKKKGSSQLTCDRSCMDGFQKMKKQNKCFNK